METMTKEAKDLLVRLYKERQRRAKNNIKPVNYFGNSDELLALFGFNYDSDYMADLCWELNHIGYIHCALGDDLANDIELSRLGIAEMENLPKETLLKLFDNLTKLIP